MMLIRPIAAEETLEVRWPILRPGFPRETAIFEGDSRTSTVHLGAFQNGVLVGVASIYAVPFPEKAELDHSWQLRGMATVMAVRGLGFGRALLQASEDAAREANGALLWCNARLRAAPFYERHRWKVVGAEFDIPTVGPHFRMVREL